MSLFSSYIDVLDIHTVSRPKENMRVMWRSLSSWRSLAKAELWDGDPLKLAEAMSLSITEGVSRRPSLTKKILLALRFVADKARKHLRIQIKSLPSYRHLMNSRYVGSFWPRTRCILV